MLLETAQLSWLLKFIEKKNNPKNYRDKSIKAKQSFKNEEKESKNEYKVKELQPLQHYNYLYDCPSGRVVL